MADDLQRSMFYLQLNQATKLSDRRLMEEIGEDFDTEIDRMSEELGRQLQVNRKTQVATADIQGEASLRSSRYQAKAQVLGMRAQVQAQSEMQAEQAQQQQQAPQTAPTQEQAQQVPGLPEGATVYAENAGSPNEQGLPVAMSGGVQSYLQPGSGGIDLRYVAQRAVSYLRTLREQGGEQQMNEALNQMKLENPPLHQLVVQLLNDTGSKLSPTDGLKNPAQEGTPQASPGRQIG